MDFWGHFPWKKNGGKKSAQKPTAAFKSEFGSSAAEIHCKDLPLTKDFSRQGRAYQAELHGGGTTMGYAFLCGEQMTHR